MGLQAYQQAAARAENPREAEYRLFGQVTRALMEAQQLPDTQFEGRVDALDWNRRLWSALATDCSQPENSLPMPLRAQIISISLWVGRHTSAVIRREEEIGPLIDINRIIMQGLHGGSEAA
ncbi:flagellar biosynthesis regulator FlaF [Caulobacter sp. SLTY]|jgi:flagellar protein FlaF|uniref:flagellar biosynthesis regulator FlaF n=1 Tax=Caulobacter sp. SLTY TaxID=2683262 RepID=UPI001413423A|nr:flagellar biosynthesis regulator FlaF [Caulobacter sp. SLTY]NBB15876.1 flagellar biosynthesis regulator FlaF [Caulobacter sp. SLTY]